MTVVRLEWDDEALATQVAARIAEDLQPSLLLFLTAIQRIEIAFLTDPSSASAARCARRLTIR